MFGYIILPVPVNMGYIKHRILVATENLITISFHMVTLYCKYLLTQYHFLPMRICRSQQGLSFNDV